MSENWFLQDRLLVITLTGITPKKDEENIKIVDMLNIINFQVSVFLTQILKLPGVVMPIWISNVPYPAASHHH